MSSPSASPKLAKTAAQNRRLEDKRGVTRGGALERFKQSRRKAEVRVRVAREGRVMSDSRGGAPQRPGRGLPRGLGLRALPAVRNA